MDIYGYDYGCSAWTVMAAALALVAHLFVAGMAQASLAGAPGVMLCSGMGHAAVPAHHDPGNNPRIPDCCAVGCAMVAGAAALPKLPVVFPPRGNHRAAPATHRVIHVESHELADQSARAPPASDRRRRPKRGVTSSIAFQTDAHRPADRPAVRMPSCTAIRSSHAESTFAAGLVASAPPPPLPMSRSGPEATAGSTHKAVPVSATVAITDPQGQRESRKRHRREPTPHAGWTIETVKGKYGKAMTTTARRCRRQPR
jgi:hypothetical protein